MRRAALTLPALLALAATAPADEPTKNDLLRAIEKQLKAAHETAGHSVACVVVSRNELYPKPAGAADVPGKLGAFSPADYVNANGPDSKTVARALDLSDVQNIPDHGYACGVVIDAGGLVLTPYHVVEGATKVYVHLPGRFGSYADIHAADSRSDLAVLKLIAPPQGLKAIRFSDVRLSDRALEGAVFEGKLVVLMANPYVSNSPIGKPSAALGSLTRVRFQGPRPLRGIPRSDSYYKFGTLLEHDAKLNAGVTGAALLNLDGEMIGLSTTTAAIGAGDSSAGYAIPMDAHVRRIIDVLRRGGEVEYGFLGVIMDDGRAGIGIDRVTPLGPAARAGIDGGDVITHINGTRVGTYEDLLVHIGSALAGSKIKLTIARFGRTRDVEVTLAKFKHEQPFIASVRPDPVFGLRVDYSSILAQQQNTDPRAGLRGVPAGVSVRDVLPNSPAAAAFKRLGDAPTRWLVTHVNGDEVTTPAEFYKAAKGQKSLKLIVIDPSVVDPPAREVSLP